MRKKFNPCFISLDSSLVFKDYRKCRAMPSPVKISLTDSPPESRSVFYEKRFQATRDLTLVTRRIIF
jgi:hypothetical protein